MCLHEKSGLNHKCLWKSEFNSKCIATDRSQILFWEQTSKVRVSLWYNLRALSTDCPHIWLTISHPPPWLHTFRDRSEIICHSPPYKWMFSKHWAKCNEISFGEGVEVTFSVKKSVYVSIYFQMNGLHSHRIDSKSVLCPGTRYYPGCSSINSSMSWPPAELEDTTSQQSRNFSYKDEAFWR
jgi:hypothetical protein